MKQLKMTMKKHINKTRVDEETKFDICADFFLSINIDLLWEEFNKTMQVINNSLIDKNYKFKDNYYYKDLNTTKDDNKKENNNDKLQTGNVHKTNEKEDKNISNNLADTQDNNIVTLFNTDSSSNDCSDHGDIYSNDRLSSNIQNEEIITNVENENNDEKKKENDDEPPPTILNYLLPLMEAYLFIEEVILVSQYKLRKFKDLERKVASLNVESIKINEKLAYDDSPFYINIYNKKKMMKKKK